jgi:hypothetical protein
VKPFPPAHIAQAAQPAPAPSSVQNQGMLDAAWVPFWQTLSWIFFWIFLLFFIQRSFSQQLGGFLTALVTRVQQGSPLKAGADGIEIGSPPPAITNQQVDTATSEGVRGIAVPQDVEEMVLHYQKYTREISETFYLLHATEVITPATKQQAGHYRVRIWLEADTPQDYNQTLRVTYRLHDSFKPQVIATESQKNQFELWLNVWGEFTVVAYVERNDKPPVWVTRYLDLPGRPTA